MVFPSLYEGFGGPSARGDGMRLPGGCSDATSLPEVCGDAALPFDPRSVESIAGAAGPRQRRRRAPGAPARSRPRTCTIVHMARLGGAAPGNICPRSRNLSTPTAFDPTVRANDKYLAVVPAYNEQETVGTGDRLTARACAGSSTCWLSTTARRTPRATSGAQPAPRVVRHPVQPRDRRRGPVWVRLRARRTATTTWCRSTPTASTARTRSRKLQSEMGADRRVDMVCGSRFLTKERGYPAPISRRTGIHIFAFMLSRIIGQRVSDPTSGLPALQPARALRSSPATTRTTTPRWRPC